MRRAIELAKKGSGFTSPNPCVGAVVVKGGKIVGEGWHKRAGDDHAEIVAVKSVMNGSGIISVDIDPSLFQNAELYVTLEPCSHDGKTPACAKFLVESGFKKVNVGMKDPFKKVNGKGIRFLRKNGVKVNLLKSGSKLSDEVRNLNQAFIKWATFGLPYVVLKAGISLDGKIATSSGQSKWITSDQSRKEARLVRSKCDAVLVGAGTVRADDCKLASHGKYKNKSLQRVVIDRKLSLPIKSKIFRDGNVLVATTSLASSKNKAKFKGAGIPVASFGTEEVSVLRLLKYLAARGVQSVFVEGGSGIHGSFYDASLKNKKIIDEFLFYMAPKVIGGKNSPSMIGGLGLTDLSRARDFVSLNARKVDEDLRIQGVANFY